MKYFLCVESHSGTLVYQISGILPIGTQISCLTESNWDFTVKSYYYAVSADHLLIEVEPEGGWGEKGDYILEEEEASILKDEWLPWDDILRDQKGAEA